VVRTVWADPGFTVISKPAPTPLPPPTGRTAELEFAEHGSQPTAPPPPPTPVAYGDDRAFEPDDYGYQGTESYGPLEEKPTRANWLFAFWGVSAVLGGLGLDVIAIVMFILSVAIGWLGYEAGTASGFAGASIFAFAAFGLLIVQQGVTFLGYGLCLGSPARGAARLWAIVPMCLALTGVFLAGCHFVLASAQFSGKLYWATRSVYPAVAIVELLKWVFFL